MISDRIEYLRLMFHKHDDDANEERDNMIDFMDEYLISFSVVFMKR